MLKILWSNINKGSSPEIPSCYRLSFENAFMYDISTRLHIRLYAQFPILLGAMVGHKFIPTKMIVYITTEILVIIYFDIQMQHYGMVRNRWTSILGVGL